MAWGYRSLRTSSNAAATSHSVTMPDWVAYGDLLVIVTQFDSATTLSAVPSGYALAYPATIGTSSRTWVYYKRANAGESTHTLTSIDSRRRVSQAISFWGVNTGAVVNVAAASATGATTIATPQIVNNGTNGLILYALGASTAVSGVSLSGATELADNNVSSGPTLAVYSRNYSGSNNTPASALTATFASSSNLDAVAITFDSNDLTSLFLGRPQPYMSTADNALAQIGSKTIRTTVHGPVTTNRWVYRLGGRFGVNSGTSLTARIALYQTSTTSPYPPNNRIAYTSGLTTSTAMTSATGGENLEAPPSVTDGSGAYSTAFRLSGATNTHYGLGLWNNSSSAVAGIRQVAAANIPDSVEPTTVNEMFYQVTSTSATAPPSAMTGSGTTAGHWALWAHTEENLAPLTPAADGDRVFSPAAGATPTTLTPVFQATFADLNGVYGDTSHRGVDRGDTMTAYELQVRRASDAVAMWSPATFTPTAGEISANLVNRTYAGTALVNNVTYEWRIRQADRFGIYSAWSAWTSFTPRINGNIAPFRPATYTGPGTQVTSGTPTLEGIWTHPLNSALTSVRVQLSTSSAFASNPAGGNLTWTSQVRTLGPIAAGSVFALDWAGTTWTGATTEPALAALAADTTYYYRFQGTDANGLTMPDWSSALSFKTNAAPGVPTDLLTNAVSGATTAVVTTRPTISFSGADSDDIAGDTLTAVVVVTDQASTDTVIPAYANGRWSAALGTATVQAYGLYTWTAYLTDGTLYSGGGTTLAEAVGASGTFRYTAPGAFTPTAPVTYIADFTNRQTNRTPTITFTWTHPDERSLVATTVHVYADANGTLGSQLLTFNSTATVASGATGTISWGGAVLSINTAYWYTLEGTDQDGVAATVSTPIRFKVNDAPGLPSGLSPASGIVTTTRPLLAVTTISDTDDTPETNLRARIRLTRPDASQTVVETVWNAATSQYEYQTDATRVPGYGTYSWQATAYDGQHWTGATGAGTDVGTSDANALYTSARTFIYSVPGTITAFSPTTYTSGNQVGFQPTFSGTWTSDAGVSLASVQVEISVTNNFTSPQFSGSAVLSPAVASGSTFSASWVQLGLAGALTSGTTYYYRMRGIDSQGLAGAWIATQAIKTEGGPNVPALVGPSGIVTTLPVLEATVTDADTPVAGLTVTFRIVRPDQSEVTRTGFLFDAATARFRYQTTSSDFTAYGLYTWTATAFDGTLYSGNSTTLAGATYATALSVRYTVAGALTTGTPSYPVANVTLLPARPTFSITWTSAASRSLATLVIELYDATGVTKLAEDTRAVTIAAGASSSALWTVSDLAGGAYQYRVTGVDQDGVAATPSALATIVINRPPLAPALSGPTGSTATPVLAGAFHDPDRGVETVAVPNGTFESDVPSTWESSTNTNLTLSGLVRDTSVYYAEGGALRQTVTANTATSGTREIKITHKTNIPVTTGQTYTLSAWVRSTSSQIQPRICLRWYNGNTYLSDATAGAWTPTPDTWFNRSWTATVPANATNMRVGVTFFIAAPGVTGSLWLDNVTVTTPTGTSYGDYYTALAGDLYTTIDGIEYRVTQIAASATPTEQTTGVLNYTIPTGLLGNGESYRLVAKTADSFNVFGPTAETTFTWTPAAGLNTIRNLRAFAVLADPVERNLIADMAPLRNAIGVQLQFTRVDGYVVASAVRSEQVLANAFVQTADTVTADAFIVRAGETGRLVKRPGSVDWKTLTGWYVSDAEKSNGDAFIAANYTTPFEFTVSGAYRPQAIGIAFSPAIAGGTGVATVSLSRYETSGWTTLTTVTVTTAQLRQNGKLSEYGQTATWLMLPITGTLMLEDGDRCAIGITQTGTGANYLTTANAVGMDGVTGYVLNCLIATNAHPVAIDTRPWILPNWLEQGVQMRTELRLVDAPDIPIEMLVTSIDCPIIYDNGAPVTLRIGALAILNGGLIMEPGGESNHKLWLESGAGLIVNGMLRMRGNTKTRYALLADSFTGSGRTVTVDGVETIVVELTLDRDLVGWELDDEIYIQDGLRAARHTRARIAAVNGRVVRIQQPVGINVPAGHHVVNLTRDAEIRSVAGNASIAMFDDAIIDWRRAALIDFAGNPVFNPGPYTLVNLEDVVFETGANTASGLDLDSTHVVNNLTIVSDDLTSIATGYAPEIVLRINGDFTHQGEILLIDSGTVVPTRSATLDLIVIDPHFSAPRASVTLEAETSLTARVQATAMPASATLIVCAEGNTQRLVVRDSRLTYLATTGAYGVITVMPESVLYALEIIDSVSNYPWLKLEDGAVLANASINGSISTADALIVTDRPALIQLRDPMNPSPPPTLISSDGTLWTGEGLAGTSQVSTKYDVTRVEGFSQLAPNLAGSSGNARLFQANPGHLFTDDISRHPLLTQELLQLRVAVLGQGTLTLGMTSSVAELPTVVTTQNFSASGTWSIVDIELTANQAGVAILTVTTSGRCWVDQVIRLA